VSDEYTRLVAEAAAIYKRAKDVAAFNKNRHLDSIRHEEAEQLYACDLRHGLGHGEQPSVGVVSMHDEVDDADMDLGEVGGAADMQDAHEEELASEAEYKQAMSAPAEGKEEKHNFNPLSAPFFGGANPRAAVDMLRRVPPVIPPRPTPSFVSGMIDDESVSMDPEPSIAPAPSPYAGMFGSGGAPSFSRGA
jgi:hypothetical protein